MNTKQLQARLIALAERLNGDMDDPDVVHRLRLLEPGIEQLEVAMTGIETKVDAVAQHRAELVDNHPKSRRRAVKTQH